MCRCNVHVLYTAKYTCTYIHMGILFFCYNSEPPDPWTSDLTDVSVSSFREEVGPTVPLTPTTSVLALFQMFFTTTLMGVIVEQTNIYARHILGESRPWREVTVEELWAFFGFCILMGINHLPAIHHYWSSDPQLHYEPVAGRITRDRFLSIWWFLHFTDNGHHPTMVRSHHPHQIASGRSTL